jgi:hypothetical protein
MQVAITLPALGPVRDGAVQLHRLHEHEAHLRLRRGEPRRSSSTERRFVPIDTGMTADVPKHITAHKYQLFFSFYGSVQHSVPGLPYQWSAIVGASEIALGDDVTGFMVQPGGLRKRPWRSSRATTSPRSTAPVS